MHSAQTLPDSRTKTSAAVKHHQTVEQRHAQCLNITNEWKKKDIRSA